MSRDFRLGPLCAHWTPGLLWVRLWATGPGVLVKDSRRHPLRFSERQKLGRGRLIGWLWVGRLRGGP